MFLRTLKCLFRILSECILTFQGTSHLSVHRVRWIINRWISWKNHAPWCANASLMRERKKNIWKYYLEEILGGISRGKTSTVAFEQFTCSLIKLMYFARRVSATAPQCTYQHRICALIIRVTLDSTSISIKRKLLWCSTIPYDCIHEFFNHNAAIIGSKGNHLFRSSI